MCNIPLNGLGERQLGNSRENTAAPAPATDRIRENTAAPAPATDRIRPVCDHLRLNPYCIHLCTFQDDTYPWNKQHML